MKLANYKYLSACHAVVDVPTLVEILEKAIAAHFAAMATPTLKPEQLSLTSDPGGYGWQSVTSHLSLPPAKMEEICRTGITASAGLVLNSHLMQTLPECSSLEEEYRVAVKTLHWSSQFKPKSVVTVLCLVRLCVCVFSILILVFHLRYFCHLKS